MTHIPVALRKQVRQRAAGRCEYCRKPENVSAFSHQIDHIVASKHDGPTTLDNLAWACFRCNNAKGSDIAAYDEITETLTPLYNPRTQNWAEHFEMDGPFIVGKTPVGRVTVRALQMNHPQQIEVRQNLIEAGLW